MPFNNLPWTAPLPCCQLIDLLKETGRMEKGKVRPTHERRGIGTDTRSISFDKECRRIDRQEIQEDRVIGRTI